MLPVLIKIGPITIHTYGFLLATGVLISILMMLKFAKDENMNSKDISDLVFYTLIIGLLGAKLYLFIIDFSYYTSDSSRIVELFTQGGVFYGGLIFGLVFAIWFIRKKGLNIRKIGDISGPAIALAHFFGRLGCFSAGCCFGRNAQGCSIGVIFPDLNQSTGVPTGHPIFPTQLMEALLNLLNFFILFFIYKKRKKFDGQIFVLYLFNYSIIRLFVEYFRGDPDRGYIFGGMNNPYLSLSIPQAISLAGIVISVFLYFKFKHSEQK